MPGAMARCQDLGPALLAQILPFLYSERVPSRDATGSPLACRPLRAAVAPVVGRKPRVFGALGCAGLTNI